MRADQIRAERKKPRCITPPRTGRTKAMPKISPFEKYAAQYEKWFGENRWVYEAELRAVKAMLPDGGRGVEIGVGTGRFAEPLGIKLGVEPSRRMSEIAQKRGIRVLDGVAEDLPLGDAGYDFVLMVTTVCFVDDIGKALLEAHRVLSHGLTITHILLSLGVERARDCDASVLYLNLMTDSLSSKFRNRKDMMLKVNPLK
jgi:SAM-dependent methyltransferase